MLNPQPAIRYSAVSTIRSRKRASKGVSNGWTSLVRRVKLRPSSRATMCRPGSTHRSCAVSYTRIFRSRSSNFIAPPLHHEAVGVVDAHVEQLVEPLLLAGELQPGRRPQDALHRD